MKNTGTQGALAITIIAALTAISAFAAEDTQVQIRSKGNQITRTTTRRVVKPVRKSRTTTTTTSEETLPQPLAAATPAPVASPPAKVAPVAVPAATTPVAEATPSIRPVNEWLRLRFVDEYYGPSLGDPREFQYDPQEVYPGDSQSMLFTISTGYKINKRFQVYWNTRFIWTIANSDPDSGLRITDGRLYLSDADILTVDTFKISAKYYIQPAMDHKTREINRLVAFAFDPLLNYDIPDTKFSISTEFLFRYIMYQHGRDARYPAKPTKDMDLVFYPAINWQILPTLAANLAYEMDGKHHKGQDWFTYRLNTVYGTTYLQPGLSWDAFPSLNINPYLTIYTGDKVSLKTTNLTIVAAYTLF